jgi:hypothetical protein
MRGAIEDGGSAGRPAGIGSLQEDRACEVPAVEEFHGPGEEFVADAAASEWRIGDDDEVGESA